MCPHSVTVKRKSIWLQWAIIGHNRDEADSQERDWETCELETSAVHHGILRPTFSLQEQHRCPRITYTDASLHLHSAVLLLPEPKLLLGVGEEGWKKLEHETSLLGVSPLLEHSPPYSPPNIKRLSLIAFAHTSVSLVWVSFWLGAYYGACSHAHRETSIFSVDMINVYMPIYDWCASFVQDLTHILMSKWKADCCDLLWLDACFGMVWRQQQQQKS